MLPLQLERLLEDFESHWEPASEEKIAALLDDVKGDHRSELLAELIMTDLEKRLRSDESPYQVEQQMAAYLAQFPELDEDSQLRFKIVAHWEALAAAQDPSPQVAIVNEAPSTVGVDSTTLAGLQLPCQFGKFVMKRVLGRGGMGIVYEAEQLVPKRTVAIKVLHSNFAQNDEAAGRFAREIELASRIDDPGVVPIYESGTVDNHNYYVMPVFRGGTLRQWIQRGHLSARDYARIVRDLATAVATAHAHGIVHRDLKPGNVLFDRHGRARIADFGLSKQTDQSETLTHTGQICGTPGYIAPERIAREDKNADDRPGDIYALGAILYDALCGRPPFRGRTPWETFSQAVTSPPVPPSKLNPEVDRDLETICLKCLQQVPEVRYPSSTALAEDLDRYLGGKEILARRPSWGERSARLIRQHPARVGLVASFFAVVALSITLVFAVREMTYHRREFENQRLMRDSESYGARIAESSELMLHRKMGWRERSLNLLAEAASFNIPNRDEVRLRSRVATSATQHDLEAVATLAPGVWADALAFDPSGEFLAVGQNKDLLGFSVWLYRVQHPNEEPYRIWIDSSFENARRYGSDLSRPEDGARAIAFSPDGKRLAIGTRHGRVHLFNWDGEQATLIDVYDPVPGIQTRKLVFSPWDDSLWLLADDFQLQILQDGVFRPFSPIGDTRIADLEWSSAEEAVFLVEKGRRILRFDRGSDKPVWEYLDDDEGAELSRIDLSRDGRILVVEYFDGREIELVETAFGIRYGAIFHQAGLDRKSPSDAVISNDQSFFVTTSYERMIRLWDIGGRRKVAEFEVPERGGKPSICFSPTQPLFAVTEHFKVSLYRIAGTDLFHSVASTEAPIFDFVMDAKGSQVGLSGMRIVKKSREEHLAFSIHPLEGDAALLDYLQTDVTVVPRVHQQAIDFGGESFNLVASDLQGLPRVIPSPQRLARQLPEFDVPRTVWVGVSDLDVKEAESHELIEDPEARDGQALALKPVDGKRIHVRHRSKGLGHLKSSELVDVFVVGRFVGKSGPGRIRSFSTEGMRDFLEFSAPDSPGTYVALWQGANHPSSQVRLDIKLHFKEPVEEFVLAGILVVPNALRQGVNDLTGESREIGDLVTHFPTNTIWGSVNQGELRVWDGETSAQLAQWINSSKSAVAGLGTLTPMLATGRWIVSGTIGGEIFLFDPVTRELRHSELHQPSKIRCLTELPDRAEIAVGYENGQVQLLDLPSLRVRQTLVGSELAASAACFDPQRGWLLVGSDDGTITIWKQGDQGFNKFLSLDLMLGRLKKLAYVPAQDVVILLIEDETSLRCLRLGPFARLLDDYGLAD